LIETLQRERRVFMKPLMYDARQAAAFPNALLLDCGGEPLPMHIESPFASLSEVAEKRKAVASSRASAWVWTTGSEIPPLPERARGRATGPYKKFDSAQRPVTQIP
jgi:Protein of unknown function (DUF1173)